MRGGVADGRVAGDGFHLAHGRAVRAAGQRLLDAAMLVAERNFEVQHFLARALKAEMSRFDDAGVHRPDRDFVDFAAVDAEEIPRGRARRPMFCAHGLEPRMPSGLSPCCSQTSRSNRCACGWVGGERRIASGGRQAAADGQRVVGIEGDHGHETGAGAFRHAKPRAEAARRGPIRPPSRGRIPPPATRAPPPREDWWRWPAGRMEWRRSWRGKELGDGGRPGFAQAPPGSPSPSHEREAQQAAAAATMTPAVSRTRWSRALAARTRGRPSTMAKTTRVRPKKANSRQPRKMARRQSVSGRERRPQHPQFAEKRAEGRTGRDGKHAGDKDRRRTRRQPRPCRARRPSTRAPAARRMLPALKNSAPLVRPLLQT